MEAGKVVSRDDPVTVADVVTDPHDDLKECGSRPARTDKRRWSGAITG